MDWLTDPPRLNIIDPQQSPSTGAGKSSFLDCVSLRNQQFNGSVFINAKPADESYYFMTGACLPASMGGSRFTVVAL